MKMVLPISKTPQIKYWINTPTKLQKNYLSSILSKDKLLLPSPRPVVFLRPIHIITVPSSARVRCQVRFIPLPPMK